MEEFYDRMDSKAKLVAQMLIDIDEIDTELLRKIERNNPLSLPNEKIIIYDYKNRIVFSSDRDSILIITTDRINEIRLENEARFRQKPYEALGRFYAGEFDRIVVFVAATDIFGIKKIKRLRIILIIVFFASLVIIYFAGRIFASRALEPISNMVSQVDKITISNLNQRLDDGTGKDELARLAHTFNKMLTRLENSFAMQRSFIANASHELRTPLTIITGQLEVVLLKAREKEEYQKTLISVLGDIRNLNSLSNRLLLLAQASADKQEVSFTPIRIDDTLWKARSDVLKRFPHYSINVSFDEMMDDEAKLTLSGNEVLLQTAWINLMDNACKYSENRRVDVFISGSDPDFLTLEFVDEGMGIPVEDRKMIFQPFYRAFNVLKTDGHGIGLSLVERIIDLHEGIIGFTSELTKGTTFSISIPVLRKTV